MTAELYAKQPLEAEIESILELDRFRQKTSQLLSSGYLSLARQVIDDVGSKPLNFERLSSRFAPNDRERGDCATPAAVALALGKSRWVVDGESEGEQIRKAVELAESALKAFVVANEGRIASLEATEGVPLLEASRALQLFAARPQFALTEDAMKLYFVVTRELMSLVSPDHSQGSGRPRIGGHASAFSTSEALRAVASFQRRMQRTETLICAVEDFFADLPDALDPILPTTWIRSENERRVASLLVRINRLAPQAGLRIEGTYDLFPPPKNLREFMEKANSRLRVLLYRLACDARATRQAAEGAIRFAQDHSPKGSQKEPRTEMAHQMATAALQSVQAVATRVHSLAFVASRKTLQFRQDWLFSELCRRLKALGSKVKPGKREALRNGILLGNAAKARTKPREVWKFLKENYFSKKCKQVAEVLDQACELIKQTGDTSGQFHALALNLQGGDARETDLKAILEQAASTARGMSVSKEGLFRELTLYRRKRFASLFPLCRQIADLHQMCCNVRAEADKLSVDVKAALPSEDGEAFFQELFTRHALHGCDLKEAEALMDLAHGEDAHKKHPEIARVGVWVYSRALSHWRSAATEALSKIRQLFTREVERIDRLLAPGLAYVERVLERELASQNATRDCDHGELAFAAASVAALRKQGSDPRLLSAKSILCDALDHHGRFRVVRPVDTARSGYTCLPTTPQVHRAMAQLLEVTNSPVEPEVVRRMLIFYSENRVRWGDGLAWPFEFGNPGEAAFRWPTAICLLSLDRIRRMLSVRINRRILPHFRTTLPRDNSTPPIDQLMNGDAAGLSRESLQSESVMVFLAKSLAHIWGVPAWGNPRWNAVLYGPPGTGKTTLPESLAATADVPLVEITPSDITLSGEALIESRARNVFLALSCLTNCVVVLDECDPVLRSRKLSARDPQSVYSFLTPGLLPKLRSLNARAERQRTAFFLMTNRVGTLDDAAIRNGRFDARIGVFPPDALSRLGLALSAIRSGGSHHPPDYLASLHKSSVLMLRLLLFVSATSFGSISLLCKRGWLRKPSDMLWPPISRIPQLSPLSEEVFAAKPDFKRLYPIDGIEEDVNDFAEQELNAAVSGLAGDVSIAALVEGIEEMIRSATNEQPQSSSKLLSKEREYAQLKWYRDLVQLELDEQSDHFSNDSSKCFHSLLSQEIDKKEWRFKDDEDPIYWLSRAVAVAQRIAKVPGKNAIELVRKCRGISEVNRKSHSASESALISIAKSLAHTLDNRGSKPNEKSQEGER